jgi:hypothetical protein
VKRTDVVIDGHGADQIVPLISNAIKAQVGSVDALLPNIRDP